MQPLTNLNEVVSFLQQGQASFSLVLYPDKFSYGGKSLMVYNKVACKGKFCLVDASNISTLTSHNSFGSSIKG